MTCIDDAVAAIARAIQANLAASGPLPADFPVEPGFRLTGLAVAIMGDLTDAGWTMPDVEPTPPDPDNPGWPLPWPAGAPAFCRDLDPLVSLQYRMGMTARDWAVKEIAGNIGVWAGISESRAKDPATFPVYWQDLSMESLASRIVGQLLGGGWTSPVVLIVPSATGEQA